MTRKELEYLAEIDYSYYCLKELEKHLCRIRPKTGLDAMIDNATGRTVRENKEALKESIYLTKHIIKRKKQLNYDATSDESFLVQLTELQANFLTKNK